MTNELLLRVEYQGAVYDLPVDNSVPLRVDMSTVENQDIGKYFGIGSQTFDLPGTKEVNRFFNYAYDVSIDDVPAMYNTIPCSVILNGETLLDGQLQLQEVVTNDDGYVGYKVLVTDSTIQFKNALEDKLIKDVDLSAYDHTLTVEFVTSSWWDNGGTVWGDPPLNGAVFYPLCDFGTDNVVPFPEQPRIMIQSGSVFFITGSLNDPASPMTLKQFQPAIRVPELLDAVFAQAGFSYTSSLEDRKWRDMYVLPKAEDKLGPVLSRRDNVIVGNTTQFIPPIGPGSDYSASVHFNQEVLDENDNYNPFTYTFTAPTTTTYDIYYSITLPNVGQESGVLMGYYLRLLKNGVLLDQVYVADYGNGTEVLLNGVLENHNMFAGDTLTTEWKITNYNGSIQTLSGYTGDTGNFTINSDVTYEGATIVMSDQFDQQSKTIDLVKGFIEQFNLVLTPEPNQSRVIRIETFDDWIRQGEVKDWTYRYNTATRKSINHTVNEQPKQLLFRNEDDADRISKLYKDNIPNYQYGTLRSIATSNIAQGEEEIGKFFAPIALAPMVSSSVFKNSSNDDTDNFTNEFADSVSILPHLYKLDNNQQTSYKFKPRLGYKITGLLFTEGNYTPGIYMASGSTTTNVYQYSTLSNVEMVNPLSAYPFFAGYTRVVEGSLDINFSSDTSFIPNNYISWATGSDSFTTYWKTYIDSLYWEGSKKVTLDLYFEPHEYKDIQLNDRIIIKGQYYRINKISGFNISHRDVVTVELIKLYPAYIPVSEGVTPAPSPTPTPTPTPSPTPGPGPTPTPTPSPVQCYTYSVENYNLIDPLYFRYYECDCTTLVDDNIVPPDSATPDFCACPGSVQIYGTNTAGAVNQESTICTV